MGITTPKIAWAGEMGGYSRGRKKKGDRTDGAPNYPWKRRRDIRGVKKGNNRRQRKIDDLTGKRRPVKKMGGDLAI